MSLKMAVLTGTVYPGVIWGHTPLKDNNANKVNRW